MAVRASYREAVRWIADNDEPDEDDPEFVSELISVQLVADLWRKSPGQVARAVVRAREGNEPAFEHIQHGRSHAPSFNG
jgi:hypothetical protein